jgi:hypothetical protein
MNSKTTTTPNPTPLSIDDIAQRIQLIRGQRVILDTDLAAFYGETTKRLNQQVNRNAARFPEGFMFQLNEDEFANLRLQFATSSLKETNNARGHGGRRYAPLAFTEHGAIMASMVLASPRATELSVHVVKAFVELRAIAATHSAMANQLHKLHRTVSHHDKAINELMDSMQALLAPPAAPPKRQIGFITDDAPVTKSKPKALKGKVAKG